MFHHNDLGRDLLADIDPLVILILIHLRLTVV
jgi:hypothetical protein